jgi:hypothetical protein
MSTTYILGAGASKFAGLPLAAELLPALREVLQQLQGEVNLSVTGPPFIEFIDRVRPHIPKTRLYNDEPDLEFAMALVDWPTTRDPTCPPELCKDLDDVFNKANLHSFIQDTNVVTGCKTLIVQTLSRQCKDIDDQIHDNTLSSDLRNVIRAWTDRIQPGDHIITFNWDVLNEIMLRNAGKWHWQNGYGFVVQNMTESQELSPTPILKLHGSINWVFRGDHIWLDDQSDNFFHLTPEEQELPLGDTAYYGGAVIAPSYLKRPKTLTPNLNLVWQQAENALRQATQVISIGYSLPDADFYVRDILRCALRHNDKSSSIQVVLPHNKEVVDRWRSLCGEANKEFESNYETFNEFLEV